MADKKVSDIIIEMEGKMNELYAFVRSIDSNIKLILNNLNTAKPVNVAQAKTVTVEAAESVVIVNDENIPKRVVQQQVLLKNGEKPIILANVEIFNSLGGLQKKTRTNQAGRWIAPLVSGSYSIYIYKRKNAQFPDIDFKNTFVVEAGEGPIELERIEI